MIRGEIWLVDFGVPMGSEAGYRRPAVVVQNDDFNESNISTCKNSCNAEYLHERD